MEDKTSEIRCPQAVPLLLPSGRTDAEHRQVNDGTLEAPGFVTFDGGISWFDPGDPFSNVLSLMVSPTGDDWTGTVFYAGLPCLTVHAGDSYNENDQWQHEVPQYLEPSRQEIHALFFERVVGDLPEEGDEDWKAEGGDSLGGWPFPHAASVMVHEVAPAPERPVLDAFFGDRPAEGQHYDLYHHLMPESGSQGYEIVNFIGVVAHSMWKALPNDLPEPRGF